MTSDSILFIPGLALSQDLFSEQKRVLDKTYSVRVADHTKDTSFSAMAQRILHHAPDRFALAGLSMGGYATFEIIRQAPKRITRLALLDTSYKPDTVEKKENRIRQIEIAKAGKYETLFEPMWEGLVAPWRRSDYVLKEKIFAMMRSTGAESFIHQQQAIMNRVDSTPLLPSINIPTLVLVGEEDALTPPEIAHEMVHSIPGAILEIVPKCGHLSAIEQPDKVTAALSRWLKI